MIDKQVFVLNGTIRGVLFCVSTYIYVYGTFLYARYAIMGLL